MFKKSDNVCLITKVVCPKDAEQCPWFWETVRDDITTGESKVVRECGIHQLPFFLTAVIAASNRPAAEIGAMRTELLGGLTKVVGAMKSDPQAKLLEN